MQKFVGVLLLVWLAVFTILMSFLKKGDRVVAGRALFGSCHHIITKILPRFGIEVELIDGKNLNAWEKALKKKNFINFFRNPFKSMFRNHRHRRSFKISKKKRSFSCCRQCFCYTLITKTYKTWRRFSHVFCN